MPVDTSLIGREFGPTEPYEVSRAKLTEFAAVTGCAYEPSAAPATFPIVIAFGAMLGLMSDPSVGIELHNVVHGDQRFVYQRPVTETDVLTATLTVENLRQIGGADIISTRSDLVDASGELVVQAYATLVHKAGA
ncbi:MAG: MaoC family dehydratase N-terminal domain-containing protein [Nocardioidaceae bacterium]|nr:MAG: MaoC family dehydratase N-terminal domain-containing protein [Nocardioidaceae bacterium]